MKKYNKDEYKGTTSLYGGTRVDKDNLRIECYGTVDELNSHIGLIRDQDINPNYKTFLLEIQNKLFGIGAVLATPVDKVIKGKGMALIENLRITQGDIEHLEEEITRMSNSLTPMTHFILPGGHPIVSYCHIARCVCRRAERLAVHLSHQEEVSKFILQYLNRLSDYLFVLSRQIATDLGIKEIRWIND